MDIRWLMGKHITKEAVGVFISTVKRLCYIQVKVKFQNKHKNSYYVCKYIFTMICKLGYIIMTIRCEWTTIKREFY